MSITVCLSTEQPGDRLPPPTELRQSAGRVDRPGRHPALPDRPAPGHVTALRHLQEPWSAATVTAATTATAAATTVSTGI